MNLQPALRQISRQCVGHVVVVVVIDHNRPGDVVQAAGVEQVIRGQRHVCETGDCIKIRPASTGVEPLRTCCNQHVISLHVRHALGVHGALQIQVSVAELTQLIQPVIAHAAIGGQVADPAFSGNASAPFFSRLSNRDGMPRAAKCQSGF